MTAPANWHDAACLKDLLNSVVTERPDSAGVVLAGRRLVPEWRKRKRVRRDRTA